jgi:hypothetical protein
MKEGGLGWMEEGGRCFRSDEGGGRGFSQPTPFFIYWMEEGGRGFRSDERGG